MKKIFTRWFIIAAFLFIIANIIGFIFYSTDQEIDYSPNELKTCEMVAWVIPNVGAFVLSLIILGASEFIIQYNIEKNMLKEKKQKEYKEHLKNYKKTITSQLDGGIIKRITPVEYNHAYTRVVLELNGVMTRRVITYPLKIVEKYIKEINDEQE